MAYISVHDFTRGMRKYFGSFPDYFQPTNRNLLYLPEKVLILVVGWILTIAVNAFRKSIDIGRLAKVLALTDSPNDHEAILAARTAARMLRAADLTYSELFSNLGALPQLRNASSDSTELAEAKLLISQLKRELYRYRCRQPAQSSGGGDDVYKWRRELLTSMPLMNSERKALIDIKRIDPKSKEEYYVRWLARRYQLVS